MFTLLPPLGHATAEKERGLPHQIEKNAETINLPQETP
jgi:hypothetical protein